MNGKYRAVIYVSSQIGHLDPVKLTSQPFDSVGRARDVFRLLPRATGHLEEYVGNGLGWVVFEDEEGNYIGD